MRAAVLIPDVNRKRNQPAKDCICCLGSCGGSASTDLQKYPTFFASETAGGVFLTVCLLRLLRFSRVPGLDPDSARKNYSLAVQGFGTREWVSIAEGRRQSGWSSNGFNTGVPTKKSTILGQQPPVTRKTEWERKWEAILASCSLCSALAFRHCFHVSFLVHEP